ncbi:MAG: hypothetical protein EA391_03480 [Balneolaceae bacterium]|nr:MAG: hypothetical protein EA391_03480 [Balneolaceae bacterium]
MTKKKKPLQKKPASKKRGVLYLLLFSLIVIGIAGIYLIRNAEDLAKNLLINQINEQLAPHAEIEIEAFSFSVRPAAITLRNANIVHTTPFDEIEPVRRTDSIRLFELNQASVEGVNLFRLLVRRQWSLGSFTVDGLNIEVVSFPNDIDDGNNDGPFVFPLYVAETVLKNSNFAYYRDRAETSHAFKSSNISATVSGISFSEPNAPVHTFFNTIAFSTDMLSYITEDGLYQVHLYDVDADTAEETFRFSKAELIPQKTATQIARERGFQSDQYNFTAGPVKASGVNQRSWFENEELKLTSLIIENLDILINRDKTYPREERGHRQLPQQQFLDLPFVVSADTIKWNHGSIRYIEKYPQEGREGEISFFDVDVTIHGLQNYSRDDSVRVRAAANFLNEVPIEVNYLFSVRENAGHSVSGYMGGFNMEMLNPIIENMAAKQIRSGILNEFRFNFHANEYTSNGSLQMIYNDLELRFLDEESLEETRSRRLRSFFANRLRVRSENERDNPREGTIDFERDIERSIFNYWWRSVLSGIEDVVIR